MAESQPPANLGSQRFADSTMPNLAKPKQPKASDVLVMDVDITSFGDLVTRSNDQPVVLVLYAAVAAESVELAKLMEVLVRAYDGRLALGKVDLPANPQIAEALGIQAVPTVLAVVAGRPVPLFQGTAPAEKIQEILDQLLQAAAQAGVGNGAGAAGETSEPPVPPLHQAGYDAIEQGDLAAARAAFTKAVAKAPGDQVAKAALAQVDLMERLEQTAAEPASEDRLAQALAQADSAVAAGQLAAGFDGLLDLLAQASPQDRDTIRLRLLELFEVAGLETAEVAAARKRLAAALF